MFININIAPSRQLIEQLFSVVIDLIWPLITLIIFFSLKESISIFIKNMKSGSAKIPGGIEVSLSSQQKNIPEEEQTQQVAKIVEQEPVPVEDIKKLKDEKDQLLISNFFERTYRLIFNSQLNLLLTANQSLSISRDQILEMYNTTQWANNYPFEQYINFLVNSNLILYNIDSNSYSITPTGKLFIQYLFSNSIPIIKLPLDWKSSAS